MYYVCINQPTIAYFLPQRRKEGTENTKQYKLRDKLIYKALNSRRIKNNIFLVHRTTIQILEEAVSLR